MPPALELSSEEIQASRDWVEKYYRAFDSFNLDYWIPTFHHSNITINLCSNPTMAGFDAIRAHFQDQQALLTSMQHDLKNIDVLPDRIYVRNVATFIVKNDPKQQEIKINAVCLFWKNINEDKVSRIEVYFDPKELIERIQMFI